MTSTPNKLNLKTNAPKIDLDVTSDYNSSGSSIDTSQGIRILIFAPTSQVLRLDRAQFLVKISNFQHNMRKVVLESSRTFQIL